MATLLVTTASVLVASSVGECVDSLSNCQLSLSASSLVSVCVCVCVCMCVYVIMYARACVCHDSVA